MNSPVAKSTVSLDSTDDSFATPRWTTLAVFGGVALVSGGLLGFMLAVALLLFRLRSLRRDRIVRQAVVDAEQPAIGAHEAGTLGFAGILLMLVFDAVAVVVGQYLFEGVVVVLRTFAVGALVDTDLGERLYEMRILLPLVLLQFLLAGRYRRVLPLRGTLPATILVVVGSAVGEVLAFGPRSSVASVPLAWLFVGVALVCSYHMSRVILAELGLWYRHLLFVGEAELTEAAQRSLGLVGGVVPSRLDASASEWSMALEAAVRSISQSDAAVQLVICPSISEAEGALSVLQRVEAHGVPAILCAGIGGEGRDALAGQAQLRGQSLMCPGVLGWRHPFAELAKRFLDISGAAVGFLLSLPLLIVVAPFIVADGGPLFYGHSRVGRGGRQFKCLKLRSMKPDADAILAQLLAEDTEARCEWERDFKLRSDPRVTRIGFFLRKTSLDELPQLWNILVGEMSLVGPRPIVEKELKDYYSDRASSYLSVRPGLTGLWQISGRNDTGYDERIELDTRYAHNWSLGLDILILLRTVEIVIQRRGAY